LKHLLAVAQQFASSQILEVREYGRGNIHATFLVTLEAPAERRFILQRLNTRVFRQPQLVMQNLRTLTEHLEPRLAAAPLSPGRRFEVPRLLPAWDGRDYFIDPQGSFWRALSFIEGAETFDVITDMAQANEVGYALGRFHNLLSDLPPGRLADTLPGFHVTPGYLAHYDEVLAQNRPPPRQETAYAMRSVADHRGRAAVLETAVAQGRLPRRVIHGDPKVNNVLFQITTGQAVALVDLDTVKPGLVHYDIGDCLRSGCNHLGEETELWERVRFEPELCRAILEGYLQEARGFLRGYDYDYLFDAILLLAFELGLRFFTDYLAGNVYFKAGYPEHNLARALVQFKLTESIASQEAALGTILREFR
jgi:Ser/Thr protein kinase RdoA (MazF antagonist)